MCILCGVLFGFPLGKVLSLVFLSNFWLVASTREMQDIFPNLDAPLREYVLMKKYIIKRNNLFLSFSEPVTQILFCLFYPQMIERNSYLIMKVFVWPVVPNTLNLKDVNMLYCWAVMFSSWIMRQSGMFQHIFTTEWQKIVHYLQPTFLFALFLIQAASANSDFH